MRNIIFILLLIACAISKIMAQNSLPYKTLEQLGNDTASFVKYNFKDRVDVYKGKKFKFFFNDLKIKPNRFSTGYTRDGLFGYLLLRIDRKGDLDLIIYWKKGYKVSPFFELMDSTQGKGWKQEYVDFLSEYEILDIGYKERLEHIENLYE